MTVVFPTPTSWNRPTAGSLVSFARAKTAWRSVQLLGAGCLLVVVLTHICEALELYPSMQWGSPTASGITSICRAPFLASDCSPFGISVQGGGGCAASSRLVASRPDIHKQLGPSRAADQGTGPRPRPRCRPPWQMDWPRARHPAQLRINPEPVTDRRVETGCLVLEDPELEWTSTESIDAGSTRTRRCRKPRACSTCDRDQAA